jgi:AcrR family transcriptional regulator
VATDRGRLSLAPASTKARMRQARQELSRNVILDAAERVFAEHGFGAAKMQDVAALAKVSTSTVYELFEGKEALYEAVHTRHGAELLQVVSNPPTSRPALLDRLLGGVAAYAGYLMDHPDYLRILSHVNVWAEESLLASQGQVDTSRRGAALVTRGFEKGIAVGLFAPGDARLMTRLMHATHQVRLLDWLEDGMRVPPAEVIRRMQRELVCMFCPPEHIAQLLAERQLLDPAVDAG